MTTTLFFANQFYPDRDAYLGAIADAMRDEYEAIAGPSCVLQLDCPNLARGRHIQFGQEDLAGSAARPSGTSRR